LEHYLHVLLERHVWVHDETGVHTKHRTNNRQLIGTRRGKGEKLSRVAA
jgi:hypothetical protein